MKQQSEKEKQKREEKTHAQARQEGIILDNIQQGYEVCHRQDWAPKEDRI